MASSESYLTYILDELSSISGIRYRKMMGEYILYIDDAIFGGIYDDRFLVKDNEGSRKYLSKLASPYSGAAMMLECSFIDDKDALENLIIDMKPYLKRKNK